MLIEIEMDRVILNGHPVPRPTSVPRSMWLEFWKRSRKTWDTVNWTPYAAV